MPLKEALLTIIRHAVGAITALLLMAVMLEWLLPGSALPLIDAVDPLPAMIALTVLLFVGVKRASGWGNAAQIIVGLLAVACMLAILALSVPNYTVTTLGLLAAGVVGVAVWAAVYSSQPE